MAESLRVFTSRTVNFSQIQVKMNKLVVVESLFSKLPPSIRKNILTLKCYLFSEDRKYLIRDLKSHLLYVRNNEYGIPEPLINYTVLRFWIYPSYWHYQLTKILRIFGLWKHFASRWNMSLYWTRNCV